MVNFFWQLDTILGNLRKRYLMSYISVHIFLGNDSCLKANLTVKKISPWDIGSALYYKLW